MLKDKFEKSSGRTAYELLPIHKKEGINIFLVRKERRITQKQLGEVLDLSNRSISKIEAGKRRLDNSEMVKIANFLNVPLSVISPIK